MCLGIPGQVVRIADPVRKLGVVDVAGVEREVNLACIVTDDHPLDACVGDWVLVHVGFAMSRIDPAEVDETLRLLAELGEIQEQLTAMRASGQPGGGDR